ncbi:DNA damage-inducible transcript 4 protein [Polypterus senegalus]
MPALYLNLTPDNSPPSSPVSDDSTKRLSWGKLVQKLTDFSATNGLQSDTNSFTHSETHSLDQDSLSDSDFFSDPLEESLCSHVVAVIERTLTEAKDSALGCSKLLIPDHLMEHIGQELLHLAASEPCGLRGALIDLYVEHANVCQTVEQISVDPDLVPTFQLTLVLRLESGGFWPRIQDLFTPKSFSAPGLKHALRLSTGFRVIKRKLYSSEELLIEEC